MVSRVKGFPRFSRSQGLHSIEESGLNFSYNLLGSFYQDFRGLGYENSIRSSGFFKGLKFEYFFPVGSFTLIQSGFFLNPKLFFVEIFDSEFLFLISSLTQLFELLFLCSINLVSNAIY